ncbi:hypothetical protein [Chitinasiproducens palmae]|uniref:hypothetical protein n=1 Tax=Chitinasiproducens palmae TaxID=1770053 RepID=UPI0011145A51|nr:hypothetical protein [Chitinasiproducens palmae]
MGGSVSMNYQGSLTMSYGPTLSQSKTSTTQARDSITLAAGTLSPTALAGWLALDKAVFAIQGRLATLALANAALTGVAVGTTTQPTVSTLADFDNNKSMLASTVANTGASMAVNLAAAVTIGLMMKTMANALKNVTQASTLQLDNSGAVLKTDLLTSANTLTMNATEASLKRLGAASAGNLEMGQTSSSLDFQTGAGNALTGAFAPTLASSVQLSAGKAALLAGPPAGGPSLTVSASPPSIKGSLTAAGASDYFQQSAGSFFVTAGIGARGSLALSQTSSSLLFQGPGGDNGIGLDSTGVAVTAAGSTINAGPAGVTVQGALVRLG